jgi:hypothetical protein
LLHSRGSKIIQALPDDLFARQTQQLAGSRTGIAILTIVIRDQDWSGRLKYDCPEQQLKFFGAVP